MKIAVVSSTVFAVHPPMGTTGYSGLEVLAWQQAEGLAKKGHEVSLVAPQGSKCDHATVIPTGPPGGWDEKKAYSVTWEKLLDQDVILDHSWSKWSYCLKKEGRLKAPVLGVCHAPVNTMYQSLPPGVEKPCFVCISQDQANHFEALFGRPARVAKNCIDLDFYKPIEGVKRTNRYLFLARFSTIKGPDLALAACRKVGVGLDLVGDTSITQEPEFFEKCSEMCDGTQLKMVGPATRGECVAWFSQAHCLLHPNQRFREPLGLAPLESMACENPTIAWRYGAMSETVRHGETGFLVNSLDEMTELIRTDAVRNINRKRCREWVASEFPLQKMIDRYEALCQEALDSGGW